MGNCHSEDLQSELELYTPQLAQYKLMYVIGKGGFGRVWKVQQSKRYYAMKEMFKAKILQKQSVQSIMNERHLLQVLNHPFLVNMKSAFQTTTNLYIILDLMEGGDLRYHLCRQRIFNEEQTKFFVICILIALQYLHLNLIIHRDVKPENLVFDSKSYLRLTDLGIARIWRPNNKTDTSGTPGYMAPEVMLKQNHGVASDYFALGVVAYECLTGNRPYQGKSRGSIKEKLITKQVKLKKKGISKECTDFVNSLLERKAASRLGFDGPEEVMKHKWLQEVNWDSYRQKSVGSPYIIKSSDNFDHRFTQKISEVEKMEVSQELFKGYTYAEYCPEQTEMGTNANKILQKQSTKLV